MGKWQVNGSRYLFTNGRAYFDFLAKAFNGRDTAKKAIGEILVFADETQQEVFGFNRRTAELGGFVAGKEYDAPRSLGVSLKHS
jgi:hypothetical protein